MLYDLKTSHPRLPGEDSRAYDFRLAKALIEESRGYASSTFSGRRRTNTASTIRLPWRSGPLRPERCLPAREPLRPHPLRGGLRCQEHRRHAARHTAFHREGVAVARFHGPGRSNSARDAVLLRLPAGLFSLAVSGYPVSGPPAIGICSVAREFFPGRRGTNGAFCTPIPDITLTVCLFASRTLSSPGGLPG